MLLYFAGIALATALVIIMLHGMSCKKVKRNISGKHVVVIGGSSGIGKSFAKLAFKQGAKVTIVARNVERLNNAAKEIGDIDILQLDVSNFEVTKTLLLELDNKLPINMLVNCAGLAICGLVEDLTVANAREMFDINYFGSLYPVMVLMEKFKKRRNCIIVLTSSQAALLGIFGFSVYSSTKYALRGFAEALAMELGPYDGTVTLALPPDTDTPGYEIENQNKPEETHLISKSGGLFHPDVVAKQMLEDAINGKFFSTVGMESYVLTTLSCGMSPAYSFFDLFCQCSLMGLFRFISVIIMHQFTKIVKDGAKKRMK